MNVCIHGKWTRNSAIGLAVSSLIGSAFAFSASAQDLETLTLLTPNRVATSTYAAFVAEELGFYEDEGLEVVFNAAGDTTVPYVAFLNNREVDLTMLDSAQVLQALQAGQEISVIYEVMQYAPDRVSVKADSPIQSLSEMKGKTVGLASDRDRSTLQMMLDLVGLSIDDVSTVVVGDSGPVLAKALEDETIDAFAGGGNDTNGIETAGLKLRNLTPPAASANPGNSFVILNSRKEELRDKVSRFLRAYSKANNAGLLGYKIVGSIAKKYRPDQWEDLSAGYKLLDTAVYETTLVRTRLRGEPQPYVWRTIQPPYVKIGELDEVIDTSSFLDASFIEAANDYTTEEVRSALVEWQEANQDIMLP
jgi:NitT/TauT family transport system substrate-binding protein